ncbi:hypothetical protein [Maricaulis maris]|uniref:hypothetical protein n=1 Tax=Maricaulis maris TaxID=74318 RepID=UPI0029200504|nr:hypothetical protein MACH15_26920 [Maricaulis maris]
MTGLYTAPTPNGWAATVMPVVPDLPCTTHSIELMTADALAEQAQMIMTTGKAEG